MRGADVQAVTILAVGKRPKRKSEGAAHRCAAPFPGPAAPGMAGHDPLSESSRSDSGGSVFPGAPRRTGWDPAALVPEK